MKELILITGASSGIGYEMARQLAEKKFDLILVARRKEKLEALKTELQNNHGINVYVIVKDLSKSANAIELYSKTKSMNLNVTMLVNNAGFGDYGAFAKTQLERELEMIELNISSLVTLTKLYLQEMLKNNKGTIMNLASIVSYLPFPYYTVYSATKSFVLSFTETLSAEVSDTNVQVKALCPGPVDTEFTTAEMLNTFAYKTNKPISAAKVAGVGVKHLLYGKGSKKVGFTNWFISNLPRVTPDSVLLKIKKKLASQRK